MMADTITRYKEGKPVLYYTWTPYWISDVLKPGRDVVWLEVPFSSMPDGEKLTPNCRTAKLRLPAEHYAYRGQQSLAEQNPRPQSCLPS